MTTAEMERETLPSPTTSAISGMNALVYHGPGKCIWENKPRPAIQEAGDAIVRVTTSTICGTDLHILKGDLPSVAEGRTLAHEGIGIIEQVGAGVSEFHVGDRVIISCVTACLKCDFCRKSMNSHCRHGGWILGNTIDGIQAEYVRIPQADGSLYSFPPGGDEEALVMLSDILPTGFECGVLNGQVKAGDTITTPMLLRVVRSAKLQPGKLVTHRFAMSDIMKAYDTFGNAAKESALKVVLTNSRDRDKTKLVHEMKPSDS